MFGLPEKTLVDLRQVLSSFSGIEKVEIYGSRAKGTFKPGSDIDLVVHGKLSEADMARLREAFEDLNIPYFIDVSRYEDIDDNDLREHIARVGQRFDVE